ncbi:MAG TPA: hypothetical protein VI653_29770 [Steroidobacteraceae bacterium]
MVDKRAFAELSVTEREPLSGHETLASWLTAQLRPRNMKTRCAQALDISLARLGKWLKGSIPEPAMLEKLARWSGADLFQLQLLAGGIKPPEIPQQNERWTSTPQGAMVGRMWEELNKRDPQLAERYANLLQDQIDADARTKAPKIKRQSA